MFQIFERISSKSPNDMSDFRAKTKKVIGAWILRDGQHRCTTIKTAAENGDRSNNMGSFDKSHITTGGYHNAV